jgi:hypothetical protein
MFTEENEGDLKSFAPEQHRKQQTNVKEKF